jgi:hypothetical protein
VRIIGARCRLAGRNVRRCDVAETIILSAFLNRAEFLRVGTSPQKFFGTRFC